MKQILCFLFLVVGFINSVASWACSSCSSGVSSPLILKSGENQKFYFGLGMQTDFKRIDNHGYKSEEGSIETKQQTLIAYGIRLHPRAFVTLNLPIFRNLRQEESFTGIGDVFIHGRLDLLAEGRGRPWQPQWQLLGTLKWDNGKSEYVAHKKGLIDRLGTGHKEWVVGTDFWWASQPLRYGFTYLRAVPLEAKYDGFLQDPGNRDTFIATGGWGTDSWQVVNGVVFTHKSSRITDQERIEDTASKSFSYFLTGDWKFTSLDTVRATWVKEGVTSFNRNSSSSYQILVSYMKVLG